MRGRNIVYWTETAAAACCPDNEIRRVSWKVHHGHGQRSRRATSSNQLLLVKHRRKGMPERHLDLGMAIGDDGGGQAARSQGKHELLHTCNVTSVPEAKSMM